MDVNNRRGILLGLALAVMTAVAYLPAMHSGGFVWDDDDYVTQNQTLHDLGGLWKIWTDPGATPQYYPLVHTTYWMEYRLWKLDPTGYHITNVLLHAMGAILFWQLLAFLKVPGAWLAAAFFAVHPVHVESVAWITERKNVLSGVFYLGAALAYLKWVDVKAAGDRRPVLYFASLSLFLCALLSKTVTVTLPAALLLVTWWKGGNKDESESSALRQEVRRLGKQLIPLMPFLIVGLPLAYLTVWLEKNHVGAAGVEWHLSLIDRILIAGRALWFYFTKLLWPANLSFNYPRWEIDATAWWQYLFPLSALALAALLWTARRRIGRGPLTAALFFAGTLFPALGFFDVYPMRYSFVADHFQYLASLGVLALLGAATVRVLQWIPQAGENRAAGSLARSLPVGLALVLLMFLSARQSMIYQSLETLYLDTIAKNPASWMAYNNLGQLRIKAGRPEEAIPLVEQALRHNPKDIDSYLNLGVALSRLGREDEALLQYEKALAIKPDRSELYSNIGASWARRGQYEKAISYYQKALEIKPDFATHSNLGAALASLGRFDEAVEQHGKSVKLAPDLAPPRLKFGETLHLAGRIREAEEQYRKAAELDPTLAEAHLNLGLIAVADRLIPAALDHFRRAAKQSPNFADAHRNLAKTLAAVGRNDDAAQHFSRAVELEPRSVRTRLDHAAFLTQRGDASTARREVLAASQLLPDNPDILFQLGMLDLQQGESKAAETNFRAVVERAPNHAPAHNYLAVLIAGKGTRSLEEAAFLLQKAVRLEPANAEFHNNLGVVLVRLGKTQEALAALEESIRLNPEYKEAIKNRDDLRRILGDKGDKKGPP